MQFEALCQWLRRRGSVGSRPLTEFGGLAPANDPCLRVSGLPPRRRCGSGATPRVPTMTLTETGGTVGIIGGGRIGQAFARRAMSAGVNTWIATRRGPEAIAAF